MKYPCLSIQETQEQYCILAIHSPWRCMFIPLGKFDWGVWYVFFFLYEQFWIRLAAVSKRGKKVRTMAFPVVRTVNKSRDTRNCVQNKPEDAICVICTTRSYYKTLGLILWISHYGVDYKLNSNPNLSRISDWSINYGSYFFPFDWNLCGEYRQPIAQVGGA